MKKKEPYDRLKRINGRWYEDGRILPKRELIYGFDANIGNYMISRRSGQFYKLSVLLRRMKNV